MIEKIDKSEFENYLCDAANIKGNCDKVYFPESKNEIVEILKLANKEKIQVTVSAARTGLTGGSVPENGILISLEKLNKIISFDEKNKFIIVEPGILLSELQKIVESKNLFYPPDPTETNSSIGGNVATNASGARTFKYGSTRNFVEELGIILPNGEEITLKRGENISENYLGKIITSENHTIEIPIPDYEMPNVKHAAGYFAKKNMDLIDLFIGSEGTLGIITSIKLKLIDLPKQILSMIIFFNSEDNSFSFLAEIKEKCKNGNSQIDLREIEFFDKNSLKLLINEFPNIPENSKSAIWIEQELENNEDKVLDEITEIITKYDGNLENIWFAIDENERNKMKLFRHSIALKVNDIISQRGLKKVGTDNAVPDEKFYEFYKYTCGLIKENNLDYVVYGHMGNSHLHFNMLPKSKNELDMSRKLYAEICKFSTKLGGTISAEHGIGKYKRDFLLNMFGEENILKMAKLKKTLDSNMVLSLNNIFSEKYLNEV
ncbi:MAG: FAD-binding oxidoreductase [Ignavibacteriae bacterium]|nr:FAD-binding oxidoreductase [Ignavibacteriota bacterium]